MIEINLTPVQAERFREAMRRTAIRIEGVREELRRHVVQTTGTAPGAVAAGVDVEFGRSLETGGPRIGRGARPRSARRTRRG